MRQSGTTWERFKALLFRLHIIDRYTVDESRWVRQTGEVVDRDTLSHRDPQHRGIQPS